MIPELNLEELEVLLEGLNASAPIPRIHCKNGLSFSAQANCFAYCSPRNNKGPYTHVEVGFPSKNITQFSEYSDGRGVYGYVPIGLVRLVIDDNGGLNLSKTEKSHIKLLWGNEDACYVCGVVLSGWAFSDPSNCGMPHPDCPKFGIGQEDYYKMAKEFDEEIRFREELELPEGFRFLEIEDGK